MCEPVTVALAAAAPYMAAAGAAVSLYGTMQSAKAAEQGAKAQQDSLMYQAAVTQNNSITADNNAKVLETQARDAESRGAQEAINARQANALLKGKQISTLASRGLDLNEGTPLSLQEQTDFFGQIDQDTIKDNTTKDAWRIRVGAQNSMDEAAGLRSDAGMLTSKARSISPSGAKNSALISGAGSLMSQAGSVADKWYKSSGTSGDARHGARGARAY